MKRSVQILLIGGVLLAAYGIGTRTSLFHSARAAHDLLAGLAIPDLGAGSGPRLTLASSPSLSLGVLDGSKGQPDAEFGLVQDVASFDDGRIAVLDARANTVRLFDSSGHSLGSIGRPGRGPGEFAVPVAIATIGDSLLLILDKSNRRISEYRVTERDVTLSKEFPLTGNAEDLCVIDSTLYLLKPDSGALITPMSLASGQSGRPFGSPITRGNELAQATLGQGLLACDRATHRVAFASRLVPDVRVFERDGRSLWRSTLPSFNTVIALELPDGAFSLRRPDDVPSDYIATLSFVGGSTLLVQFGRKVRGDPIVVDSVYSVTFDAATGKRWAEWQSAPVIVEATESTALTVTSDPFPRVHRYSLSQLRNAQ